MGNTITITIANSKGGVAKTTTATSIATALAEQEYKVLLIDLDGQGNCSTIMWSQRNKNTIYEVITGKVPIDKAIQHTDVGDIVPFDPRISQLDVDVDGVKGKELLLKVALSKMKTPYDFVFIDTAPSLLGSPLINALTCSDYVLIPTTMDALGIDAVEQMDTLIKKIQRTTNKKLKILGILPTKTQPRLAVEQIAEEIFVDRAEYMGTTLFNNRIRNCSAIRDSQLAEQTIWQYNRKSNAARDYLKATAELLDRVGKAPAETPKKKTTKQPKDKTSR